MCSYKLAHAGNSDDATRSALLEESVMALSEANLLAVKGTAVHAVLCNL